MNLFVALDELSRDPKLYICFFLLVIRMKLVVEYIFVYGAKPLVLEGEISRQKSSSANIEWRDISSKGLTINSTVGITKFTTPQYRNL